MAASLLNFASINIYLGLGGGEIRKKTTIQTLQSLNTVTQRSLFINRNREHIFSMYISTMLFICSICLLLLPFLYQKIISMSLAHTVCINFLQAFLWLLISCFVEVALFLSQQAIHFKTTVVQQIQKNYILKLNQFYLHLFLSELNASDTFPLKKRKYLMPPSMQSKPSRIFLF